MNKAKYVPPHMRNGASETPAPPPPPPRQRYHRKSQWELEKEEQVQKQKADEVENEKKRELTEENFPVLGSVPSNMKVWGGPKTFATLATEWDDKKKKEENEKKQKELEEQDETAFHKRVTAPLPRFHNVHRFVEPEDDEEDEEQPVEQKVDPEEQGWVTVDRKKYRREKTLEEKLARPPTPEENDETVWNGDAPKEHETCWDERY